jgi:sugar phosphate isomerase/epimerase
MTSHSLKTIKGPALFLAQFVGEAPPFDTLPNLAKWAAGMGFKGIQVPTNDPAIFDLAKAAESRTYCDEVKGILAEIGVEITELSTHLQGQLVAVHPAYDALFDGFAPSALRGRPAERQAWAVAEMHRAARASANLGLTAHATFSGALAWPYLYPWPQRPPGLIEAAFDELARRWRPILDAFAEAGCDLCYEIHPGEDLFDGATFERFLDGVDGHPRCKILYDPSHLLLQQLDYLGFIDLFHDRIGMVHVKDAEFNPTARQGVYSGYAPWIERAGRFRSLGDGQVDFRGIFSRLAQYGFDGWAVLEWECCVKRGEQGAREGAAFIKDHIIEVADRAFDDFAGSGLEAGVLNGLLGLASAGARGEGQ